MHFSNRSGRGRFGYGFWRWGSRTADIQTNAAASARIPDTIGLRGPMRETSTPLIGAMMSNIAVVGISAAPACAAE